jgi:hypothetical protein
VILQKKTFKDLQFLNQSEANIHRPAMDNLEECPADSVISASLRMNSHLTSPIVLYGYQCTPPFWSTDLDTILEGDYPRTS